MAYSVAYYIRFFECRWRSDKIVFITGCERSAVAPEYLTTALNKHYFRVHSNKLRGRNVCDSREKLVQCVKPRFQLWYRKMWCTDRQEFFRRKLDGLFIFFFFRLADLNTAVGAFEYGTDIIIRRPTTTRRHVSSYDSVIENNFVYHRRKNRIISRKPNA